MVPFAARLRPASPYSPRPRARSSKRQPPAPTATGKQGAASTVDPYATKAAIDVLRRGGNAVDAAVAAAAVLGVVEPYSAGIGGGGFMVIRTPAGKLATIDGRETAPGRLHRDLAAGERRRDRLRGGGHQRARRRRPGHPRDLGARAEPLRLAAARARAQARGAARAARLRRRRDAAGADGGQRRALRRLPRHRGALPARRRADPGRRDAAQPRPGGNHGADGAPRRPAGLLPPRGGQGPRRHRAQAASARGRRRATSAPA